MKEEYPDHVSWRVRDAWLAIPPCQGDKPYCHVDCPYFYSCWPEEEYSEDDEMWDAEYDERCAPIDGNSC